MQIYIQQNIHKQTSNNIFEELVPLVLPLLKKHIRLGHTGIMDHSLDLSIPDLKRGGWGEKLEWREREAVDDFRVVSILSQVNHKGLHHSQKKCSICLLFILHASHQTTNYPKTTKTVMTQIYIKQNIHKHRTQSFRRISPFGITPVEKVHTARTRWYRGPFRRFIDTRF